jgi:molybdenum cofactor cytidylyltransferase
LNVLKNLRKIENDIGIVLLAAGKSSRLGRPKQLLLYHQQTLLQHCFQIASASQAQSIVIVLGSDADDIKEKLNGISADAVVNPDWEEGMASSIRFGINYLLGANQQLEGVVLMVCDQPFVTSSLINNLIQSYRRSGKPIVVSGYDNTFGPPVFFHKSLFPELLQLTGDVGAKAVIKQHADEVAVVSFPHGSMDIDTEADYENFQKVRVRYDKR